jgi:hypothetical protein
LRDTEEIRTSEERMAESALGSGDPLANARASTTGAVGRGQLSAMSRLPVAHVSNGSYSSPP